MGKVVRRGALAGLALAVVVALGACGQRTVVVADGQQANTITASARSEVKVAPDKAGFSVEVVVRGDTAQEAQEAAIEPVEAVIAALKESGVDEKSIQTAYTNVSPVYDWSGESERIVGYESSTGLAVSDVEIDAVAGLMQACVAAGATGVSGPSYYVSSYDETYEGALAQAVEDTRAKAEAMAKAAGVSLGEVVAVVEGYQDSTYRYTAADESMSAATAEGGGEMDIVPGEVTIEAEVSVTYAID